MPIEDTPLDWMKLTPPQLDFWEEFSFHPDQPLSTVAHYLDIEGAVDVSALCRAIARTVHEADILAASFAVARSDGLPRQRLDPRRLPEVKQIDLTDRPDPARAAMGLMQADIRAKLDLTRHPLSAQWLLRIGENRYYWYIRAHHIILDGFGLTLIEQRCAQLYAHLLGHTDAGRPFDRFASFLAEEEAYRTGPRFAEDRRFWQDYLAGPGSLPVVDKAGEGYGAEGLQSHDRLPDDLGRILRQSATELGIAWPDLLVLLTGLYLLRHGSEQERGGKGRMTLWLPFMSRWGSVGANIPAMLLNILPFRLAVGGEEPLAVLLKRGAKDLRRQRAHGRYRIEHIAIDCGLPAGSRFFFAPLVNVLPFDQPEFFGCRTRRHVLASGTGEGFSVTYRAEDDAGALILELDADSAITGRDAFERHRFQLPVFLRQALAPQARSRPAGELYGEAMPIAKAG
ncbi:condensation domain-containing protein [Labrys sp. (in: a-proteobacteria)]|uniref:condensation domain-containing protein n=1 Tax=Labrys sp. (in: a-proteobacteria) TaxID=1917972 RepID=UPI0039E63377